MSNIFIIAEAGVNHNGSLNSAKQLIDVAADAKCDAVKFQTFKADNLTSRMAQKCEYQIENTGISESQYDMIKNLELPYNWHEELMEYAAQRGIIFMSTPFDIESARFLYSVGIKLFKIPSGEINNVPYLEVINSFRLPVILSTGMSTIDEILFALSILKDSEVSLLHCNTQYPTMYEDVNLLAMNDIRNKTDKKVGYSDHTLGIEVAIAAVALGAEIIEKHITLDKKMKGPDHLASIEPHELAQMVLSIRNIEKSLGSSTKIPSVSELSNIKNVRKSIVAKVPIQKGERLTNDNLDVKRPMGGISPLLWYKVIGTIAESDYAKDDFIAIRLIGGQEYDRSM